jgi:hypothetical protein
MDNVNNYFKFFQVANISQCNDQNSPYLLKLSNILNLKFFKDELTIKYTGKGSNNIDFAVIIYNLYILDGSIE